MVNRLIVLEKNNRNVIIRAAGLRDICEAIYMLVSLIPMSKVVSYSDIANILNTSPRIVAKCLAINENIIAIPCHRVVHKDLRIGGYSHEGVGFKSKLLILEDVKIANNRVSREHYIKLSSVL
ncbi:MAG: MGMT family protein [Desulfurococcaceae archaeon]